MPRTYPTIDGGESSCFITPKGGTISLTGDPPRVAGLERITTTPTGVSFGPLKVSTPSLADTEHTVAAIENLRFAPTKGHDPDDSESDWLPSWGDDDGNETNTTTSGLLGLSLGGAAAEADDTQLTRRQTIGVMAGALALGTTTASAQSESDQIKFAEFDLVRSDGPVHVGVLPIVDNALPPDTKLTLTVDGAKRRSWTPADALESASKPNGETIALDGSQRARVEVYAKGGVGTVDELTAWAKGVLAAEREIKATLELGETRPTWPQRRWSRSTTIRPLWRPSKPTVARSPSSRSARNQSRTRTNGWATTAATTRSKRSRSCMSPGRTHRRVRSFNSGCGQDGSHR